MGNGKFIIRRSQRIKFRIQTITTRTNIITRMQGEERQEQDQLVSYEKVLTIKMEEEEEEEDEEEEKRTSSTYERLEYDLRILDQ